MEENSNKIKQEDYIPIRIEDLENVINYFTSIISQYREYLNNRNNEK